MKQLDDITGEIVDAAFKLHVGLGPGLLESVYDLVLARVLERRGLMVERQKPVSFDFDGIHFRDGLRIDLLVESLVIVEIKSVERMLPVHPKQLLTYLRLMKLPVGLLINFGAPTLKEGLHRIVNSLTPSASPRLRVNQLPSAPSLVGKEAESPQTGR
jgi:iron complex transport system substrate-binding protein